MSARAHAEFWEAPNGLWYFHRVAGNNLVTDPSQGYSLRRTCRQAIQRRWGRHFPITFLKDGPRR